MIPARDALERLRDGNRRFVARAPAGISTRTRDCSGEQAPFAIVLGCSDSRVPPEIVFDQGIGDLFVIRVAGNIATASQMGSIEFAAEKFRSRLVVVLGHSRCGAVQAALEQSEVESQNLGAIVDQIRPALAPLSGSKLRDDQDALVRAAVRANIEASVNALRSGSDVLESHMRDQELVIIGAEYSLESGEVVFFS